MSFQQDVWHCYKKTSIEKIIQDILAERKRVEFPEPVVEARIDFNSGDIVYAIKDSPVNKDTLDLEYKKGDRLTLGGQNQEKDNNMWWTNVLNDRTQKTGWVLENNISKTDNYDEPSVNDRIDEIINQLDDIPKKSISRRDRGKLLEPIRKLLGIIFKRSVTLQDDERLQRIRDKLDIINDDKIKQALVGILESKGGRRSKKIKRRVTKRRNSRRTRKRSQNLRKSFRRRSVRRTRRHS